MHNVGSNYVALERLGTGTTGDVWRGADHDDNPVAIKILHAEYSGRRDVVRRFIQERELLTDIDHRHVVKVHDLVYDRSTLAIIMDLVDGGDLATLLFTEGSLSPARATSIASDIAMGLAAIHAADIVHLDLKPANVLIHQDDDGESALIADLGVSQLAQGPAGVAEHPRFGTPQYTAPEVVSGGAVGSAADVYALGLLMVEMLSGRAVFGTADPDDVFAILEAQVSDGAERPAAADDEMWTLISAMLDKDPNERPTAAEVALDLGVPPEQLDSSAFRGAATALGSGSVGADGTSIALDAPAEGEDAGGRTIDLGHRTSILRSAQTVRLGARGSRTIALPAALQPGAIAAEDAGTDASAADGEAASSSPRRRRPFMALSLVLGVGVLVGALSVGVFLTLRSGDDPPPPTASPTTVSAPEGSITVTDVSGMSEDAARGALGDQVEVEIVTVPGSADQDGIVQGTQPAAGSFVRPGDTVTLEVANELATQPLSALPANTAGGQTDEGSVTVDGTSISDAIVVQANKPEVQVTYMLQQRYTSVDADLVVPDDGTAVQVRVEVDGTTQVEQTVAPGGSVPVTVDVTDAQRLTITVTASDESTPPRFAFTDGVLGGEAGKVPNT